MPTVLQIEAKNRTISGRKVKTLRQKGLIPAVLYGRGIESRNLTVEQGLFSKIFKKAGESSLIDLSIEGAAPIKVLIHDVVYDPVTDVLIHIDFYQVRMTEKLRTEIPLKFVGEAPAVKELGGIFVKPIDTLEVECLPGNLVSEIEVDISSLKTFADILHLSDLKLPPGIELVLKSNEVLAKVAPPRSEEELEATKEKVEEKIEEIKVVSEEKKKEKAEAEEAEVVTEEKEKGKK